MLARLTLRATDLSFGEDTVGVRQDVCGSAVALLNKTATTCHIVLVCRVVLCCRCRLFLPRAVQSRHTSLSAGRPPPHTPPTRLEVLTLQLFSLSAGPDSADPNLSFTSRDVYVHFVFY